MMDTLIEFLSSTRSLIDKWNIDDTSEKYRFEIHTEKILYIKTRIAFNIGFPSKQKTITKYVNNIAKIDDIVFGNGENRSYVNNR